MKQTQFSYANLPDSFSEQICQLFVEIRFNNVVEKKALKQFGSGGFSYLKGQQKRCFNQYYIFMSTATSE